MIIFRKARRSEQTLNDLDEYLRRVGDEPAKWLAREVRSWGEFSYDDLAAAIEDGRLDDLIDWQARYADIINGQMAPLWAAAYVAAAEKASQGKTIFADSDDDVRAWLRTRGGELISLLSDESKRAIANVILRAQAELMNPKKIAQQIRPLIGLNNRQAEANYKYRQKIYQRYLDRGVSEDVAAKQAEKAALKYAAKQHRFRAETITHTELAFAYNQGAHAGVMRAIGQNLMGKCALVWTTAGTNRVCSRCLALKDTIVGYTNESGVTLPPLHPRCRCAISYREVEPPAVAPVMTPKPNDKPKQESPNNNPQQPSKEDRIKSILQSKMTELKIKGELIYPPPNMDFSEFVFDAEHTQGDKHPHDVTEEEARKFIAEAYFAIYFKSNNSVNYFGREGAAYVQLGKKKIRTAFKSEEYNPKFKEIIEVYEDAQRKG